MRRLPNAENARIPPEKLAGYCLNRNHPRGKNKAAAFRKYLNLTEADAEFLESKIREAVLGFDFEEGEFNEFGLQCLVDFPLEHLGKKALIRTSWIILQGEDFPRLTSCYVKKKLS